MRLATLTAELRELEDRLRKGGGPERIERQHGQGKLTARASSKSVCSSPTTATAVRRLVRAS